MRIKIYTSPGCHYCTQAKKLFERAGIQAWEEVVCRSSDELKSYYPKANSYPWIIIDGEEIGGLVDTAKLFLQQGLVSSKKSERS
ncbi:thioredoxin domain [Synechococcus phage S-H9-1]|uniref:Glutaredoxin n=1 Tax=Synechococcus phage S-H9-1 TaxID=2783674 RepID=A0A873WDS5_9CAUD|nr:thioredoxin domain [Synechococcus phage S-H9-1]QPB08138.1 glutaredoxin [Synechococcus phage S-H9-1]